MGTAVAVFCGNRCAGGGDGDRSRGGSQHSLLSDLVVPGDYGTLLVPDSVSFLIYIAPLCGNGTAADDEAAVSGGISTAVCHLLPVKICAALPAGRRR